MSLLGIPFPLKHFDTDTLMLEYLSSFEIPELFFYPQSFDRIMLELISKKFIQSFKYFFFLSKIYETYLSTSYFLLFVASEKEEAFLEFLCLNCYGYSKLVEHEILYRLIYLDRPDFFKIIVKKNNIDISEPDNKIVSAAISKENFNFVLDYPQVISTSFKLGQDFHTPARLQQVLLSNPELFI